MELHVHTNADSLSKALAEWICRDIEKVLQQRDRYTWVLTGGSSPKQLYALLSEEPYRSRINWQQLHIFWGDERAVPFSDERNNAAMSFHQLLDKVPVPAAQIHKMDTSLDPMEAAVAYEKILRSYFSEEGVSFDLVLNGMGDDGHTLSLFPGTAVIHEQNKWVTAYYLEAQSMYRITLTAPIVNRAAKVVFLCFGKNKAAALHEVLEGAWQPDLYPSQVIKPLSGQLHWFVDQAAGALLKNGAV